MRDFRRSAPLCATLALLLVGAAAARSLQDDEPLLGPPQPAVALSPERVPGPPSSCMPCHRAITEEWATSAHAIAWVDEPYQASLATKRRPKSCHGCHAPVPLAGRDSTRKPPPRAADRHLGVTCASCHTAEDGTIVGPRGEPVPEHGTVPSRARDTEAANALCIGCHATTIGPVLGIARSFVETGMASRGLSCVGCHMAPREARAANAEDGSELITTPPRPGRSHALQTPRDPAFLRLAFGLTWRTDEGRSRLELTNQAGHDIPGLQGRELHFTATLTDAANHTSDPVTLTIDARASLPADGTLELPLPASEGTLRVTAEHVDPRSPAAVVFLERTLEDPSVDPD